eukprot:1257521-Heterocapsa_arctica.AAC.1
MATKFPKFSQALAQDPATRRIWYGLATAHDFESHDGMTEENLYQKIFASHFGHLAIIFLWTSGWLHLQPKFRPGLAWFKNNESRLNHHLSGLFGFSSVAWSGHLIHVAIPESRGLHVGWDNFTKVYPHPEGLKAFFTGNWSNYAANPDTADHIFGTTEGSGTAILTFLGGFHPQTQSLWLTDIAHHHLAIGVIFIFAGHMYRTNWGIGHSLKEILDAHRAPSGRLGNGHKGLFETISNSLHFQLGLALASLGVITSLVAQHMYALPSYAFIAKDYVTQAALYTHHQYIAGFLMVGAFAHGAIFFVRDYDPEQNKNNVLARFHTLGLYVHNDVVVAFGTPEKQILVEPVFAQWIQASSGKAMYGFDVLLSANTSIAKNASSNIWLPGWLEAINSVKGALDARGSKLMPDKKDFGYSFPCDGPGRG